MIMAEEETNVVLDLQAESERVFSTLSDCLPDAQPEYLRDVSEQYAWEPQRLTELINYLIDNNNYPKLTDNEQVVPKLLKTYSVEEFLKKYPDPEKYFSMKSVGYLFYNDSKLYFCNRFRNMSVVDITKTFRECDFNLFKTKLSLDVSISSRKTRRPCSGDNFESTCQLFYDEIFFLDNIKSINDSLTATKKIKEAEETMRQTRREMEKLKGELLTCQCCYDDEIFNEEIVQCAECHLFCKNCVQKSVEINIGDGIYTFPCLNSDPPCLGKFDLMTIKTVLSNEAFEKLCTKMQEEEVKMAEVDGIFFCPFCEFGAIPPDEYKIFKCAKCKKESCRECKEEAHIPYKCEENKDKKVNASRVYVENQMTLALLRECWRCKKNFIKSDGCNKMTCTCGATMCYVCKKQKVSYDHFTDKRNPDINKCPLYTENKVLHVNEIVKAAEKAKSELQSLNLPEVDFKFDFLKGLETLE